MYILAEDEEWRSISGYPNYEISNFGRVYSFYKNHVLKPYIDVDGYERVDLYKNGVATHIKIHRLVANAFLPRPIDINEINHDDGDKRYNVVENLEWVTRSENQLHAYRTGLNVRTNKRPVRIIETGDEFESITACAYHINGSVGVIHNCLSGKRRSHLGYTFENI